MVRNLTLWQWFTEATSQGLYGRRRDVEITLHNSTHPTNGADARRPYKAVVTWQISNALHITVQKADRNAKATELGMEEMHLDHEGMRLWMHRWTRPRS